MHCEARRERPNILDHVSKTGMEVEGITNLLTSLLGTEYMNLGRKLGQIFQNYAMRD